MYPTSTQEQKLLSVIGCVRFVWNYFLAKEIAEYTETKKFRFLTRNSADLTKLKQSDDFKWLNAAPSTAIQQSLKYLDQALKQSSKKNTNRKGFPRFKKRQNWAGSFSLTMVNRERSCDFSSNKFKCPNVGWIKTTYHRDLPSDFKSCQIKREAGKWFVVFTVEVRKQPKIITRLDETNTIGIDINSGEYVQSDGVSHPIPKYLSKNQARLGLLQKALSRKKLGSANRRKAQLKVARLHWRIANQRRDFFHKLTSELVELYDVICIEDLNVSGIQRFNGHVTKDNLFAGFRSFLEYKAELSGKHLSVISRWEPTSKSCSSCGSIQEIPLSQRQYECHSCDMTMSRDLNAAINIRRAGIARIVHGDSVRPVIGSDSGHRQESKKWETTRSLVE
jgi:putative transposase